MAEEKKLSLPPGGTGPTFDEFVAQQDRFYTSADGNDGDDNE